VDDGGVLANEHTCRGAGTHPDLEWGPAPPAAELAIVARRQDGGLVWIVGGIDPAVEAIAPGGLPEGAVEVVLGADLSGWQPPCPEAGQMAVVEVVLHVLPEPVALDPATDPTEAAGLVEGTSTARTQVDLVAVGE
jgi:hypothetical protein